MMTFHTTEVNDGKPTNWHDTKNSSQYLANFIIVAVFDFITPRRLRFPPCCAHPTLVSPGSLYVTLTSFWRKEERQQENFSVPLLSC